MANAIAESSLNPESRVVDSNGYYSNGLWQFNEASYPTAGSLVTGNCADDITQQVGFLKSVVSGNALNGSSGAEVAGNFAANFERCQGCQQGSTQANGWSTRVANAATVEGWISSGNWPTSSASLTAAGGGGGSSSSSNATCAMQVNIPLAGSVCLLTKGQARALIGGALMAGAAAVALPALVILAAAGFGSQGGAAGAVAAAERLPGYGHAIRAARRATT